VQWAQKGVGLGSLMAADQKLIVLSDRGELVVAEASPQSFKTLARAQVLGGKCWTQPVLSNGRIYCRNAQGTLVCLDVSGK
jgi:outer membrane protein assembly factor BamB